jgi:hypothetical protein
LREDPSVFTRQRAKRELECVSCSTVSLSQMRPSISISRSAEKKMTSRHEYFSTTSADVRRRECDYVLQGETSRLLRIAWATGDAVQACGPSPPIGRWPKGLAHCGEGVVYWEWGRAARQTARADTGFISCSRICFVKRSMFSRRVNMRWSASPNGDWHETLRCIPLWFAPLETARRTTKHKGTDASSRSGLAGCLSFQVESRKLAGAGHIRRGRPAACEDSFRIPQEMHENLRPRVPGRS